MGGRHGAALFCVAKSDLRRASNGAGASNRGRLASIDRDGCSILRQSITMLSPNLLMAHGQNYQCCIAIRTASVPRVRARLLDIGG